jgi:hypothetical protein
MGNNKSSSKPRKYPTPEYARSLLRSRNKRRLSSYLMTAFELLCELPKFNLFDHIYVEPKIVMYMINCSYITGGSNTAVLPLTSNIDLIGCNPQKFLVYDKSKDEKIEMEAPVVLTELTSKNKYHDISKLLLRKLVKYKIIAKYDARKIWEDLSS